MTICQNIRSGKPKIIKNEDAAKEKGKGNSRGRMACKQRFTITDDKYEINVSSLFRKTKYLYLSDFQVPDPNSEIIGAMNKFIK